MNMKNLVLYIGLVLLFTHSFAQQPEIGWTKTLGGSSTELHGSFATVGLFFGRWAAVDIDHNDKIYIATTSKSNDFYVSTNNGEEDVWVICMNMDGDTLWTKVFGGSSSERVLKVRALSSGGCIIVGQSSSTNGDFSSNHSSMPDGFLIRLDEYGNVVWNKMYGGTDMDFLYDVIETSDGYLMACGESTSFNGDLLGTGNGFNWVIKINKETGNRVWSRKYLGPDGTSNDRLENMFRLTELPNNRIILTGFSTPDFNNFNIDRISVFSIDLDGNLQWVKKIGATGSGDYPTAILPADNNNFYILGRLQATIGGAGNASNSYGGGGDFWLVKMDNNGTILWEKNYGGSNLDVPYDMVKDDDGYIYMTGMTRSENYDASHSQWGGTDFWLLKVNQQGDTIYTKRMGGSANDFASGIALSQSQNNIILVGGVDSNDGMVQGNHGDRDLWVVKLNDLTTTVSTLPASTLTLYPNPAQTVLNISYSDNNTAYRVEIFDTFGRLCMTVDSQNGKQAIDISSMNDGVYILVIKDKNNMVTYREPFLKIR